MYVLLVNSTKLEKRWKEVVSQTTDEKGYCRIDDVLKNFPKGNDTTHKEISKKGQYWNFDLSWGDRVTYKVYDNKKVYENKPTVVIHFIGNHKDYMTFLRNNG